MIDGSIVADAVDAALWYRWRAGLLESLEGDVERDGLTPDPSVRQVVEDARTRGNEFGGRGIRQSATPRSRRC